MNIYGILDLPFYLWSVLFALVALITFYLPGSFFISKLKIKSSILQIVLSHALGIVLWGAQGVLLGYAQLRWLTYIYLVVFVVLFLKRWKTEVATHRRAWAEIKKGNPVAFPLAGIGISLQMLSIFGSGLRFKEGIGFFEANAYDGIMHLGFIQEISQRFPPQEPGAVGMPIMNYHIWSDVVLAELVRIFHLPITNLFFQYMPVYIAILTTVAAYLLIKILGGSRVVGNWLLFLLFFAGDAAFVLMLIFHRTFGFYTPAIDNGITQFLNIPHTFAKLIFLCSLITFTIWVRQKHKAWGLLTIVMMSTLVGFKVYFGIFAALGFSLVVALDIVKTFLMNWKKKTISQNISLTFQQHSFSLLLIVLFAVASAAIYFPLNKGAGGLFYSPLEWPKIFLGAENLNFTWWWQRMVIYQAENNSFGIFVLDLIAIVVGLICIYGTRLFGFLPFKKPVQFPWQVQVFFFPTMIIFTLLGLFTLQQAGLFNVFNFFVVAIVGLLIFSAFGLAEIQKKKSVLGTLFLIAFVLISLPRSLNDAGHMVMKYARHDFNFVIGPDEEEALLYLREHTPADAIVQSHMGNFKDSETPYVGFFSNRSTFLSGIRMLETHNQPTQPLKAELATMFSTDNADQDLKTQLNKHSINYLYLRKNEKDDSFRFSIEQSNYFTTFFENQTIKIIQPKQ
jgi:hypothetical protein